MTSFQRSYHTTAGLSSVRPFSVPATWFYHHPFLPVQLTGNHSCRSLSGGRSQADIARQQLATDARPHPLSILIDQRELTKPLRRPDSKGGLTVPSPSHAYLPRPPADHAARRRPCSNTCLKAHVTAARSQLIIPPAKSFLCFKSLHQFMAAAAVFAVGSPASAFPTNLPPGSPPFPNPWAAFQNLSGCHMGEQRQGLAGLKDYLSHFGYLPPPPSSSPFTDAFDHDLESAIATYQQNFGLNATGVLDTSTVEQMVSPRCGVADVMNGTSTMARRTRSSRGGRHLYAYFPGGPTWPPFRRDLKYAITATSATSIDRSTLSDVFARAFSRWAAATNLKFSETSSESDADITIGFYSGAHGDGEPFDGPLGTLAHAFSPTDGRFHLDAAEAWVAGAGDDDVSRSLSSTGAVDLESVAVHEIGHLLGLGHSSVPEAIMYPTIRTGTRKVELEEDDVQGIQSLYGSNPNFTPTSPATSSREMDSGGAGEGGRRPDGVFVGVAVAASLSFLQPCRHVLRRPTHPSSSMELMQELIEEVLIRVPPNEPAYLVRAALVCKSWRRILSDHGFLRRYRAFHRTPPLLGYFHNLYSQGQGPIPRFVQTTPVASPFAAPPLFGCRFWRALDCRHGRVLVRTVDPDYLVVWDPATGHQRRLIVPTYPRAHCYTGAVLCAVDDDGCDHLGCHGGPFLVLYMVADADGAVRASVYSSETHVWGPPSAAVHVDRVFRGDPGVLAGGALHFALMGREGILKYDLGAHLLSVMETPGDFTDMVLVKAEGGRLGFVTMSDGFVYLWTQQQQQQGGACTGWTQRESIELKTVLPTGYQCHTRQVIGFAEGTDTIFINRAAGVFALELKSRRARMVGVRGAYDAIIPYVGFYTPGRSGSRSCS
nr:unnamed protein product [Digitaria exilis]